MCIGLLDQAMCVGFDYVLIRGEAFFFKKNNNNKASGASSPLTAFQQL